MDTKARKQLALRLSICVAASAATWVGMDRLQPIFGDSIGYHLAWITGGAVAKGDYAVVAVQSPLIHDGKPAHITKRVMCIEGEVVRFTDEQFFCGDEPLGKVLRQTSDGRAIAVPVIAGPIPSGYVFLAGPHPRSVDSRYLGLLPVSELTRVRPLL